MTGKSSEKASKILILKSEKDDFERYYLEHMNVDNVEAEPIYRTQEGISWIAAVLWTQKLKLPFSSIWYGRWRKKLDNYDTVIVFDRNLNWNIVQYIKKKRPNLRVIAWYWNTVNSQNTIRDKYRTNCEVWSFDIGDCEKYHLQKNCQFYFKQEGITSISDCKKDFMFVGRDKGRIKKLELLETELSNMGYVVDFRVLKDGTSKESSRLYVTEGIPYTDVLDLMSQSKCIVEMTQEGQRGMSARALESLFLGRKLLTDNKETSEGFNKGNVFYLNQPLQRNALMKFMEKDITDNRKDCERYSFEQWIRNFGEEM